MDYSAKPHVQTVFCDESGFSGNNMFDSQPWFVYVATAVDEEHARATVEGLIRQYGVQGGDLKGSNLIKYNKGRKAILVLLKEHHKQIKASVFHKKYSLACKFFEYIFEPVLSTKNSLFYETGFHRFISTLVYIHLAAGSPYALEHLRDFQELMRLENSDPMHLFGAIELPQMSPALISIRDFARIHRATIVEELSHSTAGISGNWVLDVTNTALFGLLGELGRDYNQMTVICDESKPLQADDMLFAAMINRTDKRFYRLEGKEVALTFNLSGPITFGNSKVHHGIQISDVAAAAFNYVCSHPSDDFTATLRPFFDACVCVNSVWPDADPMDLRTVDGIRNTIVLEELVDRSRRGAPVLDDIETYIAAAHKIAKRQLMASSSGLILP